MSTPPNPEKPRDNFLYFWLPVLAVVIPIALAVFIFIDRLPVSP